MIKPNLAAALMLMIGLCWMHERVEAHERYVLRSRTVKVPPYGSQEWDVWLWDRKKGRVVWKRRLDSFNEGEDVHWSRDGRALAVECGIPHRLRVLVWREGYRLRDFAPLGDYTMGCVWSPDNRRLLVRMGSSGAADIDYGPLYCLQLSSWPRYKYFRVGMARKMAWKNSKTAIYWELSDDYARLKPPRLWRAP